MPYPKYRKMIEQQKRTGIISIRCGCGRPAVAWDCNSPACEVCLRLDKHRRDEEEKTELKRNHKSNKLPKYTARQLERHPMD